MSKFVWDKIFRILGFLVDLKFVRRKLTEIKILSLSLSPSKKVQVGKDQEKAQSEKDSHSKNRGGKIKINNQVLIP